ncbi:zinc-binding dehydrogenase [Bifidobacterium eulemuris]|uniref:NADPH:quinone reductase n=1 Tax=Bifidobacterium eulemuris TaxID=1765219 RepID=A0A261GE01_9BIFI|nr:zinc-binding dehydrogenase [Bifidobacterium eulemuris]OZG69196.1 NADPH:quinone reductase [Bifidobacterium eulemuris]QOL31293.1 zinc-binding dehydrogenase [Bifidobacterium eulemuris]
MRTVTLTEPTQAKDLRLTERPIPQVKPGWVLVKVHAFGLNHSEQLLRLEEITEPYITKPIIPGIECVGEIVDSSDSGFKLGEHVVSLMGGMGRTFDGGYAEYALLPEHHVFRAPSDMPWESLAAVPETYFTAWGSLFECLDLRAADTLLVRGATCALGYAAVQIAKALGCRVIATTHRESKLELLRECGVDEAIVDDGVLEGHVRGVTKALELVGPATLRDTLRAVERGGVVCNTGILGGVYTLDGFDPIKGIPNGVYLTGFFSNFPDQRTMDAIFDFLRGHDLRPCLGCVYPFEDIGRAWQDSEAGLVNGKIVIRVD